MTYINVLGGGSGGGGGGTPGGGVMPLKILPLTTNYTATAADDGKWYHNTGATQPDVILTVPENPVIGYSIGLLSTAQSNVSNMAFRTQGADIAYSIIYEANSSQALSCRDSGRSHGCGLQMVYVGNNLWTFCGGYPYDWTTIVNP